MKLFAYLPIIVALLIACTNDPYDTGDSSLSYMKAEMVDMRVKGNTVSSIITDDDVQLPLGTGLSVSANMARTDTTYRMMLYYNKVENKGIELVSSSLASVVSVRANKWTGTKSTDPLKLTSAWQAANGKYINIRLGLKVGNAGDNASAKQLLDIRLDSVAVDENGKSRRYMTLYHAQNGMPEYYTQDVYLCISQNGWKIGDEAYLRVNTYDGVVEKMFTKTR